MTRYLVTGPTGFLGAHLVVSLLDDGHEVVALCRHDPTSLPTHRQPAWVGKSGVTVAVGDVLDRASVEQAAVGCEGLFHCAGRVSRDPADAEALHAVHVEGTKTTLDAARDKGVKKVVLASSSGVVAVSDNPKDIRDESADDPMEIIASWPYYRSKLFAERAAFDRQDDGFDVVSANPTLLLGPGDVHGSSTGDVVDFLERRVPAVPGGGLSFVDVRDAARGLILAMERGVGGQRYLLSAVNMTNAAFCDRLSRISGVSAPRLRLPRSRALAQVGSSWLSKAVDRLGGPLAESLGGAAGTTVEMGQVFWYVDASKAERELGWTARDPNETLSDTIDDLRARGVVWPAA